MPFCLCIKSETPQGRRRRLPFTRLILTTSILIKKTHCIPRAICDVFGRCYSLRRLQAPTGEEFDHTVKSNRAHITYKRIKGNKLQFLSIHTRTSFSFVLAWSQGQWRALPRCSSGVPFVEQPITEQQYNTRCFQLLQILSINKVTSGSDMLLFPTSCNPNYNIAHLCTNKVPWVRKM